MDEYGEYVSTTRAAELLGVNDARVRQLVGEGLLEARRWGGRGLMISRYSVDAYRALRPEGYRKPGPPPGSGGRPRREQG